LSLDVRVNPGRMALHPHPQPIGGLRRAISFQDRPWDCDVGIGHYSSFTADGIFLCLGGNRCATRLSLDRCNPATARRIEFFLGEWRLSSMARRPRHRYSRCRSTRHGNARQALTCRTLDPSQIDAGRSALRLCARSVCRWRQPGSASNARTAASHGRRARDQQIAERGAPRACPREPARCGRARAARQRPVIERLFVPRAGYELEPGLDALARRAADPRRRHRRAPAADAAGELASPLAGSSGTCRRPGQPRAERRQSEGRLLRSRPELSARNPASGRSLAPTIRNL
jgi:hypothetical protein